MSTTPNVARDDGPWLQLRVSAREIAAESVVRFELRHPDGLPLPPFSAGSHIDLRLPNGQVRQYSLCNDPAERSRYEIGILLDPASRGGSRSAHTDIALGDLIAVGAPRNLFPLYPAEHSILFAGGIGVTPLLAMAEQLSREGASFALHCSNRSAARIPFRERIEASAFADRTHHHLDDTPHSRLDAAAVLARPDRRHTPLYVCGPHGFMAHILPTARAAGLLDLGIADDGAREVARRARGTPRIAGRLLRRVRDFANVAGEAMVTAKSADAALTRLEVDSLGLDAMDRRYLMMIADIYRGGPVGVETLAAGLSEPRDTIEEVIEPYLIQLGLVARTARGRCLNDAAWRHLGLAPPVGGQGGLFGGGESAADAGK